VVCVERLLGANKLVLQLRQDLPGEIISAIAHGCPSQANPYQGKSWRREIERRNFMTGKDRDIISWLRELFKDVNELLEATMADVTVAQAHWIPPGVALPIGAHYAHVVLSQDGAVNGVFKGGVPLFAAAWAGKTGVSELPPSADPGKPGFPDWSGWSRKVKVDLAATRKYAKAVYAASDEYLASLSPGDLERPVDLGFVGLGESTLGSVIHNGIVGNGFTHCGEISCLKGLQRKRGYPI